MLSAEAQALFGALGGSFAVSLGIMLIWNRLVAPAVAGGRSADDRIRLVAAVVSLYPALAAPALALGAIARIPRADFATERILTVSPSPQALRAVGLSCGYMLFDLTFCLRHRQCREPLIIGHHILSIVFFPYAALSHRSLLIVLFFIVTEVTNFGQNARIILLRLGHEHTTLYLVNGVCWAASFFIVRIVPSPFLFYAMVYGSYEHFSDADFYIAASTMPIPFLLNSFWFWLLLSGLRKLLEKEKKFR